LKKILAKIAQSTFIFVVVRIVGGAILALGPVLSLISYINTGDWIIYLKIIPLWAWILMFCSFIVLVIIYFFVKRIKVISDLNNINSPVIVIKKPPGGWEDICYENYQGVLWNVRKPVNTFRRDWTSNSKLDLNEIDIQVPPICPNCKSDLTQKYSLIKGYLWHCVGCSFRKRNKMSFNVAASNVKKVVKGKFRG
jgi:ribosomal protein L37AE/L43A